MARHVGARAPHRQWRRRPVLSGLLVTHVERFTRGIGDRIVVPRCQPVLPRVLAPRVRHSGFGDHGSELLVGDHVDPRCGCRLAVVETDHVLAPVAGEAADAVPELQLATGRRRHAGRQIRYGFGSCLTRWTEPRRRERRIARIGRSTTRNLLGKRPAPIADDHARDGLQEHAIFVGDLLGAADEDAARLVHQLALDARREQAHDLLLQQRAITGLVFVPDHEVDGQALQSPVRMRLDQAANEIDVLGIANLQEHDRQVARDGVAPQP